MRTTNNSLVLIFFYFFIITNIISIIFSVCAGIGEGIVLIVALLACVYLSFLYFPVCTNVMSTKSTYQPRPLRFLVLFISVRTSFWPLLESFRWYFFSYCFVLFVFFSSPSENEKKRIVKETDKRFHSHQQWPTVPLSSFY